MCDVFGCDNLNKHQEEALRFVLESKSDVFVDLLTGFGKALLIVYSYVDLTREKNIVLVVSPLSNLMKDQVSRLHSLGISPISLSDVSSELQIRAVENENKLRKLKSFSVFRWRSLRTNFNSKIVAGSRGVARVCECHTPLVNFIGQQQNKNFDVTEINLWLKFSAEPVTAGNTSAVAG